MNLLEETKEAISRSGHKQKDIIFIGSEDSGYQCTWVEFKKLANIDYHAGFGASEIATDLIIVFSDNQTLWRGEYDGSEWWEFSKPFKIPDDSLPITNLRGGLWNNLENLNEPTS